MPTFTTVALDSLIEPKASKLAASGKSKPEPKLERVKYRNSTGKIHGSDGNPELRNSSMTYERKHHWTQISPALYATPEPTPLPDSPLSFPTSPYVVDHKRRGPRLAKSFSEVDAAALHQAVADEKSVEIKKSKELEDVGPSNLGRVQTVGSSKVFEIKDSVSGDVEGNRVKFVPKVQVHDNARKSDALEREGEIDDFFDPHDTMSAKSSNEGENSHAVERTLTAHTPFAEFYDAWEELASETGIQHTATDIEGEVRELRMGFLVEMDRRKQAESHLNEMKSQWGRIREQLSIVGLSLPLDPTILEDDPANDPGEEICRQVDLLRYVSNSVGRGTARAELEEEMESQLQSKNFEIARLLDRVRYYEAVNHEMTQRNQESIETMRRLRQKRKRRQRWIWCSIGVAITLGSSALAWSYLPTTKASSSTSQNNPSTHT